MADTSVKVSFIGDAKKLKSTIDGVEKDIGGLGKSSKSFGDKFTSGFNKALPVLAGVGTGVAVLGSALKAAIADEAEQKILATTLRSVAGATNEQIAATEKWIDVTQRATGVADSDLRPALDKLVRSSSSVTEAQKNLGIAMDVSRGTGKDLDTVAQALAKVLEGNTGAAAKLVPELTGIAREGASAEEVMAALATTFKGQTAAHADTAAGKMERINIAFSEMKERVGAALLPKLTEFGDWMLKTGIPKAEEMATKLGDWWAQQDELKQALADSSKDLEAFVEGLGPLATEAAKAYEQVAPLVEALHRLEQLTGIQAVQGLIGGEKKSVDEIIRERQNSINYPGAGGGVGSTPGFATGGIMPGPIGRAGLAILHGGERVIPPGQGSGTTVIFELDGKVLARAVVNESNNTGGLPIRVRAAS